jgi:hypothetical protein
MITFPPDFVCTRYPGYYWNTKTHRLFSIKVSGELHEMKYTKPSRFTNYKEGYRVSYKGEKRWLSIQYLKSLTSQEISIAYQPLKVSTKSS